MTKQDAGAFVKRLRRIDDAAHAAVENYINSLDCKSKADVLLALKALTAQSVAAYNMVNTGSSETVQ